MIETIGSLLQGSFKAVSAPGKVVKNVLGGGKAGSAAQAALNVTAPTIAFGAYQKGKEKQQYQDIAQAIQTSDVKPDYESDNIEW
jgi:hypothetical protein